MRIIPRVALPVAVTAALALGAGAAPAPADTRAEKKAERKQNTSIRRTSRSVTSLRTAARRTDTALQALAAQFGTTGAEVRRTSGTLATALPVVTSALAGLRDGLTAAGAGISQLSAGLATTGAGLQNLGDAYGSVEYGVIGVFVGSSTTPAATITTSDVPDDGNTAAATGNLPIDLRATGAPDGAPIPVTLRGALRSAEADGAATGDPAGQFGGEFHATDATGALVTTCTPQSTAPASFALPDGTSRSLPLQSIQAKAARSDTAKPDNTSPELKPGSTCTLAADTTSAGLYFLQINAQFADLPTRAAPGTKD